MRCKIYFALLSLLLLFPVFVTAQGGALFHFSPNYLYFNPRKNAGTGKIHLNIPGFYMKVSGENLYKLNSYNRTQISLSLNRGSGEAGLSRTSLISFQTGRGWNSGKAYWYLTPGFSFFSSVYTDTIKNQTFRDSRFAPSLAIQGEITLYDKGRHALRLFTEYNMLIHRPALMIHQICAGINWRPSFGRSYSIGY